MNEGTKHVMHVLAVRPLDLHAIDGAIRDLEMMVSHYERLRNQHLSEATTRDMTQRAVHLEAVGIYDSIVDDMQRRITQLKQAVKME